ncbi:MAG: SDR family NAD(P)-dependent oxidoreductase [Planctomycetaceae bacterium]
MNGRFSGRVAVVTGAAGALGCATATMLAREGARLVLFDRDESGLRNVAHDCAGSLAVTGDASSAADVDRLARLTRETFGPAEFLAAAAGILGPTGPAIEIEEHDWDRLFAINVKAQWLAARAFIPQMREHGRGSVVLFSSRAGLAGSAVLSGYSASKGAVVLLTRSLALNHAAEHIRVNCVCPGTIESPMAYATAGADNAQSELERVARLKAMHPMNRFGTPDEVAEAALYLLSDAASFTTGVALPVDGGRLA